MRAVVKSVDTDRPSGDVPPDVARKKAIVYAYFSGAIVVGILLGVWGLYNGAPTGYAVLAIGCIVICAAATGVIAIWVRGRSG